MRYVSKPSGLRCNLQGVVIQTAVSFKMITDNLTEKFFGISVYSAHILIIAHNHKNYKKNFTGR